MNVTLGQEATFPTCVRGKMDDMGYNKSNDYSFALLTRCGKTTDKGMFGWVGAFVGGFWGVEVGDLGG